MAATEDRVGAAMKAAVTRAAELRALGPRRPKARLWTDHGAGEGLTIVATIAARHDGELSAQFGKGMRTIPWDELDDRAHELPALVEEDVAEIEAAVLAATTPPRRTAEDHTADYDAFVDAAGDRMAQLAQTLLGDARSRSLSHGATLEALTLAALRMAALTGFAGGIAQDELRDMLHGETSRVREEAAAGLPPIGKVRYDA